MSEAAGLIPVNVVTGFLGSGKTTLLRRLLAARGMGKTAVLVNEFGEVGLDHHLLQRIDAATVLLKSGCLCCTIRGDLADAIRDLYGRRERGEVPLFRRLVIETAGLADPAPIVATLASEPVIRHHFRLANIITVVDAVNGPATLDRYEESVKQVAVADRLAVSKSDIVDKAALAALRLRLTRLNPTAAIEEAGRARPGRLLADDLQDPAPKSEAVRRWLDEAERHEHAGHDPSRHGPDIASFCIALDRPLEWSAVAIWLTMLLNRHGGNILRVKGLLDIAGSDTPVVIHGVQHTVHPPAHLDAWPEGRRGTRIVFIGKGLDKAAFEASLAAFNGAVAPPSSAPRRRADRRARRRPPEGARPGRASSPPPGRRR